MDIVRFFEDLGDNVAGAIVGFPSLSEDRQSRILSFFGGIALGLIAIFWYLYG
jgi:hypothetical protein